MILCKPTYRVRRSPITPRSGGMKINNAGIIGTTVSPYNGSVGGVTNGNENNVSMLDNPSALPSARYITANPNIIFEKNAPNNRIFVICQMTKCGTDSL